MKQPKLLELNSIKDQIGQISIQIASRERNIMDIGVRSNTYNDLQPEKQRLIDRGRRLAERL